MTALIVAVGTAATAAVISVATNELYLPVLPLFHGAVRSFLFFVLPVAATWAVGALSRHSARFTLLAASVTGVVTVALSWAVWIGWIVVECGLQDNRCFD